MLVSGSGTLLQALLDQPADYPARVVAVGADRKGIEGLDRASRVDVPTFTVRVRDHADRAAWDSALAEEDAEPVDDTPDLAEETDPAPPTLALPSGSDQPGDHGEPD